MYSLIEMTAPFNSSNHGTNGTMTTFSSSQRITDQGNRYVIQLRTDEYQEREFTITPRSASSQLIIDAKHHEDDTSGGYVRRELHKIFLIPKHVDLNQWKSSYDTRTRDLTIEMPYLQSSGKDASFVAPRLDSSQQLTFSYGDPLGNRAGTGLTSVSSHSEHSRPSNGIDRAGGANHGPITIQTTTTGRPYNESSPGYSKPFDFDQFHRSAFNPQIIQTISDGNTNQKKLTMSLDLSDYLSEDIKVTVKDQELIVKAERKIETDTRKSRTSFFQSTTLPPDTDIANLRSNFVDGKLIIEAPYLERRPKSSNGQASN